MSLKSLRIDIDCTNTFGAVIFWKKCEYFWRFVCSFGTAESPQSYPDVYSTLTHIQRLYFYHVIDAGCRIQWHWKNVLKEAEPRSFALNNDNMVETHSLDVCWRAVNVWMRLRRFWRPKTASKNANNIRIVFKKLLHQKYIDPINVSPQTVWTYDIWASYSSI